MNIESEIRYKNLTSNQDLQILHRQIEVIDMAGGLAIEGTITEDDPGESTEVDEFNQGETDGSEAVDDLKGSDDEVSDEEDEVWDVFIEEDEKSGPETLPTASEATLPNDMSGADLAFLYEKGGPQSYRVQHVIAKSGKEDRTEEDLVRIYLTEIGQYALLTKEQEVILAKLIENSNTAAEYLEGITDLTPTQKIGFRRAVRDGEVANTKFLHSNLRLVVSIAKKYQASGMPLLDLVQEGNLGLMHAIEKFDYRKGFKFSTYATWWVRQSINRGIANTGRTIRLPVHAGDSMARLEKIRHRLELKLKRRPTRAELAVESELSEDRVEEIQGFYRTETLSLEEPIGEEKDSVLGDIVEDSNALDPFEAAAKGTMPIEIEKLLAPLQVRERQIIVLRFGLDSGEPKTREEVGEHFNLNRERIRQIEMLALAKLRHPSAGNHEARELLFG